MLKLTDAKDLEKAQGFIGQMFLKRAEDLEKNYAFHKAMAAHHDGLHKAHGDMSALHKAHADGLDDGHDMKAHLHKAAAHEATISGHHATMSKAHSDHADTMKAEIDTMKAMASEFGNATLVTKVAGDAAAAAAAAAAGDAPTGIAAMISETTGLLTKKALDSLDKDPVVQDKIREMVLKGVADALGEKIVPTNVRTVIPQGVRPVPRNGQPVRTAPDVPVEFAKLVAVGDEDDDSTL